MKYNFFHSTSFFLYTLRQFPIINSFLVLHAHLYHILVIYVFHSPLFSLKSSLISRDIRLSTCLHYIKSLYVHFILQFHSSILFYLVWILSHLFYIIISLFHLSSCTKDSSQSFYIIILSISDSVYIFLYRYIYIQISRNFIL